MAIQWEIFFEAVDLVGFDGHFGVDVGGDESDVANLDDAYRRTASWIEGRMT